MGRQVSKRYSRRVRDEAADVLQMCQSTPWMLLASRDKRGNSTASQDLAIAAFWLLYDVADHDTIYAEAESLLRTGWTP